VTPVAVVTLRRARDPFACAGARPRRGFCRVPRTQIAQTGRVRRAVGNHLVGRLRQHDLPAVSDRAQPGTPVERGSPVGPSSRSSASPVCSTMRTRSLLPSGHRTFPSARWMLMARSQPQPLPGCVRWRRSHPARTASVPGIRAGPGARVDLLHQPRHPLQRRQPAPPRERSASISAGGAPRSPRPGRRKSPTSPAATTDSRPCESLTVEL